MCDNKDGDNSGRRLEPSLGRVLVRGEVEIGEYSRDNEYSTGSGRGTVIEFEVWGCS